MSSLGVVGNISASISLQNMNKKSTFHKTPFALAVCDIMFLPLFEGEGRGLGKECGGVGFYQSLSRVGL